MSARDGGPAFPEISTTLETVGSNGDYTNYPNVESSGGMTLRDYFAAKAMQALIASSGGAQIQEHHPEGVLIRPARVAIPPLAYVYADAMLAAREQGGQS